MDVIRKRGTRDSSPGQQLGDWVKCGGTVKTQREKQIWEAEAENQEFKAILRELR